MKNATIPKYAGDPVRVAAKAGFITKRVWIEFFDGGAQSWEKRRWQNRRWKRLMDSGLFKQAPDSEFVRSIATLTDKGKRCAVDAGLDPVYAPPLTNLVHDEEMIRFALFLERQGWLSNWMTEQELKVSSRAGSFFKSHVRATKIPDLLLEWRAPQKKIFWAVELERTRKEFTRYYEMVGAYKGISRVDLVLVIAATESIEISIEKAHAKMDYPQAQRPMLFASMNQIIQDPDLSELRFGTKRITLGKMGQAITGIDPQKNVTIYKNNDPEQGPAWVNKDEALPNAK